MARLHNHERPCCQVLVAIAPPAFLCCYGLDMVQLHMCKAALLPHPEEAGSPAVQGIIIMHA